MPKSRRAGTGHRTKVDAFAKVVGARVKALRKEKDFTFDAFVEETGLGRGYISELERGMVVPTITSLAALARALEVTVADLVLGDSPRERLYERTRHFTEKQLSALLSHAALVAK